MSAATGKIAALVVRNFFQPILDVARMAPKTVTKGRMAKGNNNANAKVQVTLECAAAVQFMRTRRWEALTAVRLEEGGTNNKRVGGRPGGMFVGSGGTICEDVYICMADILAVWGRSRKVT